MSNSQAAKHWLFLPRNENERIYASLADTSSTATKCERNCIGMSDNSKSVMTHFLCMKRHFNLCVPNESYSFILKEFHYGDVGSELRAKVNNRKNWSDRHVSLVMNLIFLLGFSRVCHFYRGVPKVFKLAHSFVNWSDRHVFLVMDLIFMLGVQ